MQPFTQQMWDKQNRHPGDRRRLFSAVAGARDIRSVLYPGSFVDVAASVVFDDVTYVDVDKRAARFFEDTDGVDEIIGEERASPASWRFIHADYTAALDLPDESHDLLVSLYAGFVSEHCTRYLRPGGLLLVNPSHGDAAMASIDETYKLAGVVISRGGEYRVSERGLDDYLIPKRPTTVTKELLHETGRGIAYTKSPFAYLFRRRG